MRRSAKMLLMLSVMAYCLASAGLVFAGPASHFTPVDPTGDAQAAVVQSATINGVDIAVGDEVGVFDGELCVGAEAYEGTFPVTVTAWIKVTLPDGTELPGAVAGNPMVFRIWQQSSNQELAGEPTYQTGSGIFDEALTVVSSLEAAAQVSLNLSKLDDVSDCIDAGGTITYAISYDNPNDVEVTGVAITDDLPAEAVFVSATGGGVYDVGEHTVVWDIGTLGGLASGSAELVVDVAGGTTPGITIENTCTIDCNETGPSEVTESTDICAAVYDLLNLGKLDDVSDCIDAGGTITYAISYDNPNDVEVTGVAITDDLPSEAVFVSATGGGVYDLGSHTVVWDIGTLGGLSGGSAELVVDVAGGTTPGISIENTCTIDCNETGPREVTEPTDVCEADYDLLNLGKLDDVSDCIDAGGTITYAITYDNPNDVEVTGVAITDDLPAEAVFVSATGGGVYDLGSHTVVWDIGTLGGLSGGSAELVVDVAGGTTPGITIENTCTIDCNETGPSEVTESTDICEADYDLLNLGKLDDVSDCIDAGGTITYAISYDNPNDLEVTGVAITDDLPAEAVFVSATGGGVYDLGSHTVVWDIGTLGGLSGGSAELVVDVAGGTTPGITIENTCTIDCNETGPSEVTESTDICEADYDLLNLGKLDDVSDCIDAGGTITYAISYDNPNDLEVTGVAITDDLPAEAVFVSATGGGVYDLGSHTVVWDIGTLGGLSGGSAELVVDVAGGTTPGITIENTCTIDCNETGPSEVTESTDICTGDELHVHFDIKPGACPNPMNVKSKGVLPTAILGDEDFDVNSIVPSSIRMTNPETGSSIAPLRWSYEDVGTPFAGMPCDCHHLEGDGYTDLTLKWSTQEIVGMLVLITHHGQAVRLNITGQLVDGRTFAGGDCVSLRGVPKHTQRLMPEMGFLSGDSDEVSRGHVQISFYTMKQDRLRLEIFDVHGRIVGEIVDAEKAAGVYTVTWDATSGTGNRVRPGVYFARLCGSTESVNTKILVVE